MHQIVHQYQSININFLLLRENSSKFNITNKGLAKEAGDSTRITAGTQALGSILGHSVITRYPAILCHTLG